MVTKNKFGKRKIKYIKDWDALKEPGHAPVLMPTYAYDSITCNHTKRYHNCLYLLAGIGSCTRDLMDFIAEEMDDKNVISTNSYLRDKFMTFIFSTTGGNVKYCDSSVKKALSVLRDKGLIRPMKRGCSMVNPEYFWKNDDTNREGAIILELQFKVGADTKLNLLNEENRNAVIKL